MKTQGLDVFYDGDFEQFLTEDHDETTLKKTQMTRWAPIAVCSTDHSST